MSTQVKPPERLWKYREWDDHAIDMVVHGEIHFSTVQQLNDPFEFRWHDKFPTDDAEIDRFVRDLCSKTYGAFEPIEHRKVHYRSLLADVTSRAKMGGGVFPTSTDIVLGVFSASEINNDLLMWSHYADHHKGVCIGVRPDVIGRLFVRVNYAEHVPVMDVWEYVKPSSDKFIKLSITKSLRWEYEKEWRTIYRKGPHHTPGCVDRVVIGARADDKTRIAVREAVAASKQDIQILEAKLSAREYALVIRPETAEIDAKPRNDRPRQANRARKRRGRNRRQSRL